jgi:lipoate-protein ligase A
MRYLDLSFCEPAMNLAFDEALLEAVDQGHAEDTLRLWESPVPFVVLGTSQTLAEEVREDACAADAVPILRRCSAGGCVLQGPGCLNYALALRYGDTPELRRIRGSYCYILKRISDALARRGIHACHAGISDMAMAGRKVSGNAQRRCRHALLHHGTLLYHADTGAMARYLAEPRDRPDYRGDRTHDRFVAALPLARAELCAMIAEAFGLPSVPAPPSGLELARAQVLAAEKYANPAWTRRR